MELRNEKRTSYRKRMIFLLLLTFDRWEGWGPKIVWYYRVLLLVSPALMLFIEHFTAYRHTTYSHETNIIIVSFI